MTSTNELVIRAMVRPEVDDLVEWAAQEGWNPGLHDADAFWVTDPRAFMAADLNGEMIGGGAVTSYGDEFGFMGFFIVRPEYRSRGFGDVLWHARRDRLLSRLRPGATIGMDGVFTMQPYYEKGGFAFSHRDLRFQVEIPTRSTDPARDDEAIVPLAEIPVPELLAYDRTCFPAPRPTFLKTWTSQPDTLALGLRAGGTLRGYGVVRRCREGCKVGPLFADNVDVAERLYSRLVGFAAGGPLFLDVPENNPAAMELAGRHGMTEVFGCARMYCGNAPTLAHERVFGVTTFELG